MGGKGVPLGIVQITKIWPFSRTDYCLYSYHLLNDFSTNNNPSLRMRRMKISKILRYERINYSHPEDQTQNWLTRKRICCLVAFAVLMDHRVKGKGKDKQILVPCERTGKTVWHEDEGDTNYSWCDCSRGQPESSLFNSYNPMMQGSALFLSLDCNTLPFIRIL